MLSTSPWVLLAQLIVTAEPTYSVEVDGSDALRIALIQELEVRLAGRERVATDASYSISVTRTAESSVRLRGPGGEIFERGFDDDETVMLARRIAVWTESLLELPYEELRDLLPQTAPELPSVEIGSVSVPEIVTQPDAPMEAPGPRTRPVSFALSSGVVVADDAVWDLRADGRLRLWDSVEGFLHVGGELTAVERPEYRFREYSAAVGLIHTYTGGSWRLGLGGGFVSARVRSTTDAEARTEPSQTLFGARAAAHLSYAVSPQFALFSAVSVDFVPQSVVFEVEEQPLYRRSRFRSRFGLGASFAL